MQVFKDQLDRFIYLKGSPKRIVSLVPSQTELLYDLGLGDQIIGLTKFCVHPKDFKKSNTIVGGTKQVRVKKIADLKPDIICCNKEENTKEMVEELMKIAPVHVSDINTLSDSLSLMRQYGEIFNCDVVAQKLIQEIREKHKQFTTYALEQPPVKVGYFIWKDPWMVAADNTFINHLLEMNNYKNVFSGLVRYPEIRKEDLENFETPDVVFLSSEPFPFKKEHMATVKEMFPKSKVKLVDGEYFSWYGSRLKSAFDYFLELRKQLEII
ncbi:ABC transporter substrate-binding protein [Zhouia amylolytica]|uniref:ABC-type Fe3+-hydroxamate transport system, periplasmic component n=1 Tax=Zhouia amylolytica AD3 TaxID=1286632 RepID=W2UM47_9FLAO|nr:helical backbone metal receptor [Zhouia amylolytica]ETN95230.1 ABC-type Fe3+-hydroxamate transport system, periplasmic component [Zhouia amylolytica AD3]